jgi:transcriptional regulator with XRE-family HTH domain
MAEGGETDAVVVGDAVTEETPALLLSRKVGENVARLRGFSLLTVPVLAKRAGISAPLVRKIERGYPEARLRSLVKLAVALNVPLEAFFTPLTIGRQSHAPNDRERQP